MLFFALYGHFSAVFVSSVERTVRLKVLIFLDCCRHVGAYLLNVVGRLIIVTNWFCRNLL